MNELAVIVPVLHRPERVVPTVGNFRENTPPHRLVFIADVDDLEELAAIEEAEAECIALPGTSPNWARKINAGFAYTEEPFVFLAADDVSPHRGWYQAAQQLMTEGIGVVGTNDLANPRTMAGIHSTHSLIRRSYIDELGTIDEPGKVVHEGYPHEYADDELIQTAMARGAYAHAKNSIVEHLHPIVGNTNGRATLPDDDTYRRGREGTWVGRELFRRRMQLWST